MKRIRFRWVVASAILLFCIVVSIWKFFRPQRMASSDLCVAFDCKGFAEAEEIYHRADHTGNGVLKYAPTLKELHRTPEPLIDESFAAAEMGPKAVPRGGCVFKVLTAQGPYATGGARSYVNSQGDMVFGYALVARAEPYVAGSKTYTINGNGTIFETDLGPDTAAIVDKMTEFDPDPRWLPTQ